MATAVPSPLGRVEYAIWCYACDARHHLQELRSKEVPRGGATANLRWARSKNDDTPRTHAGQIHYTHTNCPRQSLAHQQYFITTKRLTATGIIAVAQDRFALWP